MKDFFTESDFSDCFRWNDNYGSPNEAITATANAKLNALIEKCPVVYRGDTLMFSDWTTLRMPNHTIKARVMFSEELPKKECNHEPEIGHAEIVNALYSISLAGTVGKNITGAKCKYCGVKMKATWGVE